MKAIALGNFDGVHIAHRAVLQEAARQGEAVCLLFREHPLALLQGKAPERLLSAAETEKKILACGISRCEYLDFSAVKDLSPEAFFETVLMETLGAEHICCGFNYSFGKGKAGNAAVLAELCRLHGVTLSVSEPVLFEGEPVSSSRIRHCIREGAIEKANQMLGYPFSFENAILEGKHLGRELGFPTINQLLPAGLVKPRAGVYASEVLLEGNRYRGLTNIGDNPTIGGDCFRSETYLFDYEGNAYGKTARVALIEFIREEKAFSCLEELRAQVLADIERAKDHV